MGGDHAPEQAVLGAAQAAAELGVEPVLRPAGQPAYMLDVGANVDSRPEFLVQFAQMGAVYAERVLGRGKPRVGLLSNGEEEGKGDERTREVHGRLKRLNGLNFVGNV